VRPRDEGRPPRDRPSPRNSSPAAVAAALVLAAGCGGGTPSPAPDPPAPPEASGSAYFVGTAPSGLGATLDLRGSDPVARAVETALLRDAPPAGPPPAVGIASIVNGSPRPARAPGFAAVLDDGALTRLAPASEALGGRADPQARRAAALLPRPRAALAPGASAVEYVVLEGAVPGRVAEVRMATGAGTPTRLAPRPR
jgi:hypothetical protein